MNIIALEGIDGSGKSTILNQLKEKYMNNDRIVFIKSPTPPFDQLLEEFWDSPAFTRLMYFAVSNYHLLTTLSEDKVYVVDRFIYSTYVTHIEQLGKELVKNSIQNMGIENPSITYLLKAPISEIKHRLKVRNNEIDNNLDIDHLYCCYYQPVSEKFGEIIQLNNGNKEDIEINMKIISSAIDGILTQ